MAENKQECSQCILPIDYPEISYDTSGKCNYCAKWEQKCGDIDFEKQSILLEKILNKHRGKSKPYDCLIGLSGGKDSCYAAYILKQKNMNPLACTFDNGYLTERARVNIKNTIETLSIGHVYVSYDPNYLKQLYRHFLLTAGEFCTVCNVGILETLYRTAKSYGIKLIVSGQSIRTEANPPKEYFTCTSGYFKNVSKTKLSTKAIKGFMRVDQIKRLKAHLLKSPYFLQLPTYVPWKEEEFIKEIEDKLKWTGVFGEQHTDCRLSDAKEYLKLKKFNVIELTAKLSSLIRDKQISRDKALILSARNTQEIKENEATIKEQIKKEFGFTEKELDQVLKASHLKYISKMDTFLSKAKNFYETLQYR